MTALVNNCQNVIINILINFYCVLEHFYALHCLEVLSVRLGIFFSFSFSIRLYRTSFESHTYTRHFPNILQVAARKVDHVRIVGDLRKLGKPQISFIHTQSFCKTDIYKRNLRGLSPRANYTDRATAERSYNTNYSYLR
jgi:hypothetical protein